MEFLSLVALGVTAFAATNLDDSLLLVIFFGDKRRYRARHVFLGQALGIGLLVAVSLIAALLALALPSAYVGLLGLLPVTIGLKQLSARRRTGGQDEPVAVVSRDRRAPAWQQAAAVAGLAIANGADNVGVYVPLFATRTALQTALLLVVFAATLAIWTFSAYYLARRSAVGPRLQITSNRLMPFVLIGLGLFILAEAYLIPALV
jgi:cadmium resistance protein CadD (predicted permease)